MTNNINGIDLSKYFKNHYDSWGRLYCIEYKGNPLELQNAIKRLQEENEGLKSLNDFNVQKIEVLQEENEKLKADLKGETEQCQKWYQLETDKHFQMLKYKQALEKIRKEYTNSIFYQCDKTEEECPCHNCIILGQLDRVQNIVKIIDEALNDRN